MEAPDDSVPLNDPQLRKSIGLPTQRQLDEWRANPSIEKFQSEISIEQLYALASLALRLISIPIEIKIVGWEPSRIKIGLDISSDISCYYNKDRRS